MPRLAFVACSLIALAWSHPPMRANMLHVRVSGPHGTPLRAVWPARAGVIGTTVDDQQRPLLNPLGLPIPPDSLRRWRDPLARDTVRATAPVEFVIDMNSGPIRIEVLSADTVDVEAQLAPGRGPIVRARGRTFVVEADGRAPSIQARP